MFYFPIHSPAPSSSQRIGSSLHSSNSSNPPPEAVVGKCVLGLCCVVLVLYAQRITSGLFELLLHAFCKHFYWIYYTLAINFRANMNTGIERSPKRIGLLCSQHYYQVRSGDPPPSSSVLGAQSAAIPIHSSGGRTIHANHHHHHSLSKSILILADDEQQGKHDLVLVAEAQF